MSLTAVKSVFMFALKVVGVLFILAGLLFASLFILNLFGRTYVIQDINGDGKIDYIDIYYNYQDFLAKNPLEQLKESFTYYYGEAINLFYAIQYAVETGDWSVPVAVQCQNILQNVIANPVDKVNAQNVANMVVAEKVLESCGVSPQTATTVVVVDQTLNTGVNALNPANREVVNVVKTTAVVEACQKDPVVGVALICVLYGGLDGNPFTPW